MGAQLQRELVTESPACDFGTGPGLLSASAAGWRAQKWSRDLEKEWQGRLNDLQQCICELLVKNQQLRESIKSTQNHQ